MAYLIKIILNEAIKILHHKTPCATCVVRFYGSGEAKIETAKIYVFFFGKKRQRDK